MSTKPVARTPRTASRQAILRRRLLPILVAGCFGSALANPFGPQVINGQASFLNQGNVLSVTNTPGAIINWQSFSINPGELTRFIQQNANSAVLNRITGQDPSQILGALQSNGRVFLVNPNGILFGQGAQVDVNGLVASTLNISNEDFLNGRMLFKAGGTAGNLKNEGTIATPSGGQVFLIAPNVENSGLITSPKGDVMLAAGHTVQLVDSLNPDVRVVLSAPENEALNLGQVIAQGGRTGIYGALVKQRGVVSADSAVVGENGKVVLKASRDTLLEAGSRTSARGAGQGGEIQVLGERVGLTGDAVVDASGQQGGGTVLVGGDYQGRNAGVQNAQVTYVGKDVQVKADAIENGDGGKVIAWADDAARVHGRLSAKGGAQSGDGGFVETSGRLYLDATRAPDVSAANGKGGAWLLDPDAITISSAASANMPAASPFSPSIGGTVSVLQDTVLQTAILAGGTVTVDTTSTLAGDGNITVDASAAALGSLNAGAGATLNLYAYNDINIKADIKNTGLPLTMNFVADKYSQAGTTGTINVDSGVSIIANNSHVSLQSKNGIVLGAGSLISTGNTIGGASGTANLTLSASSGNVVLNSGGELRASGNTNITATNISINGTLKHLQDSNTALPSGAATLTASGNIDLQGTIHGAGVQSTDTTGYYVTLKGTGTSVTTGAGNTLAINASGERTAIEVGNGKTWSNSGTISMTGNSQIRLYDGTTASTFTNNSGAQFNSFSTANWAFYSNPATQNGVVNNNGTMTIDGTAAALQSFEAIFNQGATGTLTLADGANLSLQNAQSVQGAINLPAGNILDVSEYHGVPAAFTNATFTGSGQLRLTNAAVQANFSNVSAPDTPLVVTGAATKIGAGTSVFASASGLDSTLTLDGGTLAIKGGNFSVPTGVSYNGTVGYFATGNLSVPAGADISTNGSVTLIGGWNGNASTPGVSGMGNITLTNSSVTTTGGGNVVLKAGDGGISTAGVGTGTSSTFLQGKIALDSIGAINIGKLDGDVIARTTGSGSTITIADPGALVVGATSIDSIPAGMTTNNNDISLTALGGLLVVNGGISAGTGAVTLNTSANPYGVTLNGALNAGSATINSHSGGIAINNTVAVPGILSMESPGGTISQSAVISAPGGIRAVGGTVTLNQPNTSGIIAGSSSSGDFEFETTQTLTLQTVAGTAGINAGANAVRLKSTHFGGVNQDPTAPLVAGAGLGIISSGPVMLTNSGNNFAKLAANLTAGTGTLNAFTSGALEIGGPITVDGTAVSGIATANKDISLESGGAMTVNAAINAGAGEVAMETNSISLANTVTANTASIRPRTAGKSITVGSATCQEAGCLSITNLHYIAAQTIGIGDNVAPIPGNIHVAGIAGAGAGVTNRNAVTTRIGLLSGGNVTQSGAIDVAQLGVKAGGSVSLHPALFSNHVSDLAGQSAGAFSFKNDQGLDITTLSGSGATYTYSISGLTTANADVTLTLAGNNLAQLELLNAINAGTGVVTINSSGSVYGIVGGTDIIAGDVKVTADGPAGIGGAGGLWVNAPLVSSLQAATGNIEVKGFSAMKIGATTPTEMAAVSAPAGSVTIGTTSGYPLTINGDISAQGNISLYAGGASSSLSSDVLTVNRPVVSSSGTITLGANSVGGTSVPSGAILQLPVAGGGGSTVTPPPPTLSECTSNPTLSGCSTVLPTLDTCTTAPSTAGCTAILPTVDACMTNPTQAGCTAVLPPLSSCVSAPSTPGCSVVLPSLSTCTTAPDTAGCTAVLPTLSSCTTNPAQAGCSAVLPPLSTCTTSPATAGCTAVLPTLSSCTANPTQAGCSVVLPPLSTCTTSPSTAGCTAVLPTLSSCTTNPAQAGCSVVLPTLSSCTASPTTAGCTAVLPAMSTCTAAPTTAGCTAVLPTLAQCSATPTLDGCSVVVPTASKCVLNPSAPECQVVLPVTDTGSTSSPANIITETVIETTNIVVKTTAMASSNQTQPGGDSSSGGSGGSGSDSKKSDKKTTSSTDDSGAKKNEPVKKMYCN